MSKPRVYNWPAEDPEAICLQQNTAAPGNFIINGTLSNFRSGLEPFVVFDGISRTISITSDNDLSAATFTITGTYNSQVISEDIDGPEDETVETVNIFDSVTSVFVNGPVDFVSVGSGSIGQTHWCLLDYNRTLNALSVQVVADGDITYTFGATLDDVSTVETPFLFDATGNLTNQTSSAFGSSSIIPLRYCTVQINSSTDGSLVATLLEGGII